MKTVSQTLLRISGWSAVVVFAVALFAVLKLAIPGTPRPTNSIHFDGFIELPKGPVLSVLDYILIADGSLFVTNESNGSVFKVQLLDNPKRTPEIGTFVGAGAAHGVVIDPVSRLGFVTRSESNVVDVFDPLTLRLIKHIPVADDADAIFYDPNNKLIYVAHGDAHLVTLIDPAFLKVVKTILLPGKAEYAAFDPQYKVFYQNISDQDEIAVVDAGKEAVAATWPLSDCSGPTPMAIDATNRKLFVGCSGNARLVVLDLSTQKTVASISIGANADAVAYDAGTRRLYVTGRAGVLSVIQQDSPSGYHLLTAVKLHFGAHTLTVDSSTNKVYVAYASLLTANRIAVFSSR